jgi:apolipoprotein D and lipocalin family protein
MKSKKILGLTLLGIAAFIVLKSCRSIPKNIEAVKSFDAKKYMGLWYEIARFDFRFEKNLKNTTAQYSLTEDGTIKVVNRGYNYKTSEWKQSTGKAKFVGAKDEAMLKVSFFGPFYSGYNVIALDAEYKYALVCGKSRDYLWILSRAKSIPNVIKQDYLKKAKSYGFDVSKLVWVEQE